MRYHVEIAPEALAEAEDAYLWIRRDSPQNAIRWFNGLLDVIYSLERYPKRCPRAPETDQFEEEIRQLFYGKRGAAYRVLFTVSGKTVRILHIRHGARKRLGP